MPGVHTKNKKRGTVTMQRNELLFELEKIRTANGGFLTPEAVVSVAKDEDNPLHPYFTWDDTEAAHKWRLEQARKLIRLSVTIVKQDTQPVRAYVSLLNDRGKNGYRATIDVLNDEDLRDQLLHCALRELAAFRNKYAVLSELAELFEVADRLLGDNGNNSGGSGEGESIEYVASGIDD